MKKLFFGAILDGNGANCIGIEYVEDNNICMAAVGRDGEAACLIGEKVAIGFIDDHENKMRAGVVWLLRDILHGIINDVRHTIGLVVGLGRLGWVDQTPKRF
jgi:hypothetical protein